MGSSHRSHKRGLSVQEIPRAVSPAVYRSCFAGEIFLRTFDERRERNCRRFATVRPQRHLQRLPVPSPSELSASRNEQPTLGEPSSCPRSRTVRQHLMRWKEHAEIGCRRYACSDFFHGWSYMVMTDMTRNRRRSNFKPRTLS